MQIKIDNDALFITNRLREIDKDYFVVYNTTKKRYELHAQGQKPTSYCLSCPYDCLDERLLILALKTRRENKDKLLKEIDKHNEKLEKQNTNNIISMIGENL